MSDRTPDVEFHRLRDITRAPFLSGLPRRCRAMALASLLQQSSRVAPQNAPLPTSLPPGFVPGVAGCIMLRRRKPSSLCSWRAGPVRSNCLMTNPSCASFTDR